ncbi:MAG: squalene/phytoene synthase family protein, partial [Succinivibrio sp.]
MEKVSRTFALTIPMLPQDLVDYISNAYLLCRIADTIEDDPKTPTKLKVNWLYEFSRFASNVFSDDMTLLSLHKQSLELTKEGAKVEEYALLKDMILVINRTRNYPHRIKQIIARGVAIMSEGMARSLQGIKIEKLDDLDHYCYSVAGVVGELLSALFAEHNHKSDRNVLMKLSVSFAEGLQLCNI